MRRASRRLCVNPDTTETGACSMITSQLKPKINDAVLRRWNAQRGQRNGRGGRYKRMPSRQSISNWVVDRIIDEILEEEKACLIH